MHYKKYKAILSPQNGMNLYRGCTHGCIYCDSRSRCYGMEHEFEDVEVKLGAAEQLDAELRRKRRRCMIGTGAMCDPYIPLEKTLLQTRRCIEVIARQGFGLAIQTKSDLVLRDLDLFREINRRAKCVVQMTLTTRDENLCRLIEPNVAGTRRRFEALCRLREAGIPTVVWLTPLLPFLNDTEENLRGILQYCFEAGVWGVLYFGVGVTLREGDREYFYTALDRHFPGLREKYERKYGLRYELLSEQNEALTKLFGDECRAHDVVCDRDEIFRALRTLPEPAEQLRLF